MKTETWRKAKAMQNNQNILFPGDFDRRGGLKGKGVNGNDGQARGSRNPCDIRAFAQGKVPIGQGITGILIPTAPLRHPHRPNGWSKASCIENGGMEWESLLNTAAILGHATCVRILVDYHNADIEGLVSICGRYLDGVNPLWCAASKGHLEVVDFLLSKGANANGVTTFNSTPLAAACSHGHFEVAKLLVAHGAYTDAADHHADNCMMLASCSGHLDIVKFLLNIGVDVNEEKYYGQKRFVWQCRKKIRNLEVMKALLSYNATLEADYSEQIFLGWRDRRLELLGASVLDKIEMSVGAVEYWKSALSLRYVDGTLMYPKPYHHLSCPLCDEFGEFTTVQQLEAIENNNNAVYVQSLLVRERILGTDDAGTMRSFRSTGLDYARCGDLKWCINLWLHAISMQQLHSSH
ncbi:protein fem-1 homolog C-like [Macrobrachium nipponense]|uniref:protein fem-1 homolog C-like n=1 Tax=Macrobrachium nipponense TaxID=159736 RepID=UPI0030C84ED0